MNEPEPLITPEQIETLEQLKSLPVETDEDLIRLGETFGEDE